MASFDTLADSPAWISRTQAMDFLHLHTGETWEACRVAVNTMPSEKKGTLRKVHRSSVEAALMDMVKPPVASVDTSEIVLRPKQLERAIEAREARERGREGARERWPAVIS